MFELTAFRIWVQTHIWKFYDQGCGIAMPDSYIEPVGQVDFSG